VKAPDGPRLYRQSDVEQVHKIKQLVFGEGLTLAGARRRLEASGEVTSSHDEVAEVLDALASDARTRIASVRDGLKSILQVLSSAPGTVVVVDDYKLEAPTKAPRRALSARTRPRMLSKPAANGNGGGKARKASKGGGKRSKRA